MNHKPPPQEAVDEYNGLMAQIRKAKEDNALSYADLGKATDRTRLNAIRLMQSGNISLKNFIQLAKAMNLKITLVNQ